MDRTQYQTVTTLSFPLSDELYDLNELAVFMVGVVVMYVVK